MVRPRETRVITRTGRIRVVARLLGEFQARLAGAREDRASLLVTPAGTDQTGCMSQQPSSASADGVTSWENAVYHAEPGDTVPVTAHTEEVSDVVPSGEFNRLRETSGILSDDDLRRDIRAGFACLTAGRMVATTDLAPHLVVPGLDGTILKALLSAPARGDRQFSHETLDEHLGRSIGHLPSWLVAVGDWANCAALEAVS